MIPDHAPGWSWRKDVAGRLEAPWAWSRINGGTDLPAQIGGLCEQRWHGDCPQTPLTTPAGDGQCACDCHQQGQLDLFGGAA